MSLLGDLFVAELFTGDLQCRYLNSTGMICNV